MSSILSLFHNKFEKFNNTGARVLDLVLDLVNLVISRQEMNLIFFSDL